MEKLQGRVVPRFFGHYEYIKQNSQPVDMILLEKISFPLLNTLHCSLPMNDVESLNTQCMDIVNEIHACGVIHNDLLEHNIFWNGYEKRVIVCDFASATLFDPLDSKISDLIKHWKERDRTFMSSTVAELAMESKITEPLHGPDGTYTPTFLAQSRRAYRHMGFLVLLRAGIVRGRSRDGNRLIDKEIRL